MTGEENQGVGVTMENAIKYFKTHCKIFCDDYMKKVPENSIAYQATLTEKGFYELAIKALEQEPCEDCVSRQQALKELKESAEHHANDSREESLLHRDRDIIRALPSVTPTKCIATVKFSKEDMQELVDEKLKDIEVERKKGKWVLHTYMPHKNYCSECEKDSPYNKRWGFCPNCGAEMGNEE